MNKLAPQSSVGGKSRARVLSVEDEAEICRAYHDNVRYQEILKRFRIQFARYKAVLEKNGVVTGYRQKRPGISGHTQTPARRTIYNRRWNVANRAKRAAHKAVEFAIRAGRLVAQPCARCGAIENIHAHHDDYSQPLDVIWLCPTHHRARHRELNQRATADGVIGLTDQASLPQTSPPVSLQGRTGGALGGGSRAALACADGLVRQSDNESLRSGVSK